MKKLMSLVLALALCLSAVAAIAEVPSKVVNTIEAEAAGIVFVPATEEEVAAAAEELVVLQEKGPAEYFGIEEIKIEAIDEFGPLNVTVTEEAVVEDDGKVEVAFSVDFPYAAGDAVVVLLGALNDDNTITWTAFDGVADGNGNVVVRVEPEVLAAASFVAMGLA